jgi:ABC-2 type transport system ATP-binding protein
MTLMTAMPAMPAMIAAERLTKRFGSHTAVSALSFSVSKGEIVGFLGPNGAGKTTTLRMIAGFLPVSEGTIHVDGLNVAEDSVRARARLGYMPESVPLYPELRVEEYLRFRAELKGVQGGVARKKSVDRAMELTHITDRSRWLIGELSKGYRQRVGLADALVANPPVLILDEPTASLDPNQIAEVRELIKSLGKEHTIVLSTHILPEVEAVCSRVLIMSRGTVVADGSVAQIRGRLIGDQASATVGVRGPRALIVEAVLAAQGATLSTNPEDLSDDPNSTATIEVTIASHDDRDSALESVVQSLVEHKVGVRSVVRTEHSLEHVFRQLTTTEAADISAAKPAPTQRATPDNGPQSRASELSPEQEDNARSAGTESDESTP